MLNKNRRCSSSLSNKHYSSISSLQQQTQYEYSEVQKHFITTYNFFKNQYKQKNNNIDLNQLKQLLNELSIGIKKLRKYNTNHQTTSKTLKEQLLKQKQQFSVEKRNIIQSYEQQFKFFQSQSNQKIFHLNAQFGRKEQIYKELISGFIQSINNTQKHFTQCYNLLQTKSNKLVNVIKSSSNFNQQNKIINDTIIQLVSQLNLKKQESSVLSKKTEQISSYMIDNSPQYKKMANQYYYEKKHLIDESSIEKVDEQQQQMQEEPIERDIEQCLEKLIRCGFFNQQNRKNVERMFNITQTLQDYTELLNDPIYPLVIDFLKLNMIEQMSKHQQNESQCQQKQWRVQLRNIENLSQLSISENPIEEIKFKKKKTIWE